MGIFKRTDNEPNTNMPSSSAISTGSSNRYLYSYSGADARPFAWFDEGPGFVQNLDSLHTVSISVHEAKGQARALGYRGIKGLARGVRTIAGSLIFTVINDHPLVSIMSQYNILVAEGKKSSLGWSVDRDMNGVGSMFDNYDFNNRLAVLLPPFNLAVQYVTEQGREYDPSRSEQPESAGWLVKGVEFITEGQVTSVNDIVTEMTFQFIACDFKPFSYTGTVGLPAKMAAQESYAAEQERQHRALQEALLTPSSGDPGYAPGPQPAFAAPTDPFAVDPAGPEPFGSGYDHFRRKL